MTMHFFIAGVACFGIFLLFLVLSRTLNAIVNHLVKLQYLLQKEFDMKKELLEINQLLEEENSIPVGAEKPEDAGPERQSNAPSP
jgi:hypothetical protein